MKYLHKMTADLKGHEHLGHVQTNKSKAEQSWAVLFLLVSGQLCSTLLVWPH